MVCIERLDDSSQTDPKTFLVIPFPSGLLFILFHLRFGNCDANGMLTRMSYNLLDARDCGNRIGNSRRYGKDRGLWYVPFRFVLPLTFQQEETPSCLWNDH